MMKTFMKRLGIMLVLAGSVLSFPCVIEAQNNAVRIIPTNIKVGTFNETITQFPEDVTWYICKLNGTFLSYQANQNHISVANTGKFVGDPEQLWCIAGDTVNGFRLYNKGAGPGKILTSSSTNINNNAGGNNYPIFKTVNEAKAPSYNATWDFYTSSNITNSFYISRHDTANHKMNNRNGKLAFWTDGADAGSSFTFEEFHEQSVGDARREAEAYIGAKDIVGGYSSATLADLEAKLNTLKTDSNNTTKQTDFLNALKHVKRQRTIDLEANKLYVLQNAHFNTYIKVKQDGSGLQSTTDKNVQDCNQLFMFDHKGNGRYSLYSVATGKNLKSYANNSYQIVLEGVAEGNASCALYSKDNKGVGVYGIYFNYSTTNDNQTYSLHFGNSGDNQQLVTYNLSGDGSSWRIIPVAPADSNAIKNIKTNMQMAAMLEVRGDRVGMPKLSHEDKQNLTTAYRAFLSGTFSTEKATALQTAINKVKSITEINLPNPKSYYSIYSPKYNKRFMNYAQNTQQNKKLGTSSGNGATSGDNLLLQSYSFIPQPNGKFKIYNPKHKHWIGAIPNANNQPIPLVETEAQAGEYSIKGYFCKMFQAHNGSYKGNPVVGIYKADQDYNFMHMVTHNAGAVRWNNPEKSDASGFILEEQANLDMLTQDELGFHSYSSKNRKTLPEGVEAYQAKVVGQYIHLEKLEGNIVPENTGLILKCTATDSNPLTLIQTNQTANITPTSENVLRPATDRTFKAEKVYCLGAHNNKAVFTNTTGNTWIPGHSAYIEIPNSSAPMLSIIFNPDEADITTGLLFNQKGIEKTTVYDLTGRKVENPQSGIYIVNGKKVVLK